MPLPENILYAGYGANRDPEMIRAIVGGVSTIIGNVAIHDVELCVQRYDQITDDVSDAAPVALSPKQIINSAWGEQSNFETYAIRPSQSSTVSAVLFELTPLQRALVAEWELIEFGWYDRMNVTVELEDGTTLQAETEGFANDQHIDRVVEGEGYETFLANPTAMFKTAEKARSDYLEQLEQ
ncbi:MAG: hypothetical protein JWM81_554 [Candidatus Saccharibacteria bacterium]|nr:hypothetical protein [Candidatus Saccharibacteria bacterium]